MRAAVQFADPNGTPVPMMITPGTDATTLMELGIPCYGFAPLRLDLPGHDGAVVEGFLFLPPGKSVADGPFPFVMEMHGGPFARYGNAWTTRYPWQALSRRGYAVFIANPRGSR